MRVLLVTNGLHYGGAERIVETMAKGWAARGDTVEVVATTRGGPIKSSLEASGIPVSVLGIASRADLRAPIALARIARRIRAEVIHSHLAVSDICAALASVMCGWPRLVTTVHNPGVELDVLKRALWHRSLERFDEVMAVSERVAQSLPAGLRPRVVRPSVIDLDHPLASREDARVRLGIGTSERLVMAVGRLEWIKGLDVLARAAELMPTRARFLVIGDGPEKGALSSTRLELAGALDGAADLLKAADVVVLPSRSEGFPQVALHALAAGRPVVATSVGGTVEAIRDGETGLLVPPEDPAALASAIERVLLDVALADRLGSNGLASLLQSGFTSAEMLRRTREAYEC